MSADESFPEDTRPVFTAVHALAGSKAGLAYCMGALAALAHEGALGRARVVVGGGMANLAVMLLRDTYERYGGHHYEQSTDQAVLCRQVLLPLDEFLRTGQTRVCGRLDLSVPSCVADAMRCLSEPMHDRECAREEALKLRAAAERVSRTEREVPPVHTRQTGTVHYAAMRQHFCVTGVARQPVMLTTDGVRKPGMARLTDRVPWDQFCATAGLRAVSAPSPEAERFRVDSALYAADPYMREASAPYRTTGETLIIDAWNCDPNRHFYDTRADTYESLEGATRLCYDFGGDGLCSGMGPLPDAQRWRAGDQGFLDAWRACHRGGGDEERPKRLLYTTA